MFSCPLAVANLFPLFAFLYPPHVQMALRCGAAGIFLKPLDPCQSLVRLLDKVIILDLLSGHADNEQRLHMTGFSQCLSWEREGGRNTGLSHLPASSGTVPSLCKAGWWRSKMNPTDILKQIGLVGVASKMNNSPNPPWKEKERAVSLQVPPFLTGT